VAPVDPRLFQEAVAGDPIAQMLCHVLDRLELVEKREGVDPSLIQQLVHEAVASGHREWRKLVEIETDRRWYRSAVLALAGVVLGYAACWLTH
jgi:hypothetical protein